MGGGVSVAGREDELSVTCAPQRCVRMACPCRQMFQGVGGTEVSVRTRTQWGQGRGGA